MERQKPATTSRCTGRWARACCGACALGASHMLTWQQASCNPGPLPRRSMRPCTLLGAPLPSCHLCRYMRALLAPYSSEGLDPAWLEPAPKQVRREGRHVGLVGATQRGELLCCAALCAFGSGVRTQARETHCSARLDGSEQAAGRRLRARAATRLPATCLPATCGRLRLD